MGSCFLRGLGLISFPSGLAVLAQGWACSSEGCWPGVARHATHFLLLRQKKVSKEKATLVPASLRCAAGNLRCSVQTGSKTTRFARTSFCPDPSGPPLLGASTRGGDRNTKQPKTRTRIPEETSTRHGE